jgi:LL-diaminopimelate aminotransferase
MKTQADRLGKMPEYPFARWGKRVNVARARGIDVIRLDLGNPDLPPPDAVIDALCSSARRREHHGYPGYRGIPALREEIAAYYTRRFGVNLDPKDEVVPLLGSKEGIVHLALGVLDAGDLVLVPDPGYPSYTMGAVLAGAEVYKFSLHPARGFLPDFDAIPGEVADTARMMWLNYPNNPTSATADLELFEQAVAFAHSYDLLLCHDAPYCDVVYDGHTPPSLMQIPGAKEVAVEFNSLSKTYNMAGWRVGMAVGNPDALASLYRVKSNVDSGQFRPVQEAAARALAIPDEWIETRNRIYKERMQTAISGLASLGLPVTPPQATFYIWTRVPEEWDSEGFATVLLEKAGVSVAPGSFFGKNGEGYIRISLTSPEPRIAEAVDRIRKVLKGISSISSG